MGLLSPQIDTKKMVPMCRQLATAYGAGIPIAKAIEHVGSQSRDGTVRRVMAEVRDNILSGSTLADALGEQSKYLPPFFINLLASGEQGGHLDVMLEDLADYYEDRLKMQRQIIGAMAYPVTLILIAWYVGSFAFGVLNVALGAFETGSGGGVSGVSAYFQEYVGFQIRVLINAAFVGALLVVLSRLGWLKWITGAFSTHVWPFSKVTRKFGLARFFRSFQLLLASGVSVTRSIEASAAVTANPYMERDLLKSVRPIKEGSTLVEAFSRCRLMTPLAHEMVRVGEESGKLDIQLKKAAEYHLNEATHAVQVATKVVSTLVMLGVFIAVGAIIITFWARLYGGLYDGLGI